MLFYEQSVLKGHKMDEVFLDSDIESNDYSRSK